MKAMKMTFVVVMVLCLISRQGWCQGGMIGGGGGSSGGSSGGGMGDGTEPPVPEEVNIPDLLAQFEPSWTSISLTAVLGNPVRSEYGSVGGTEHRLSVDAEVALPESIHLVGITDARGAVAANALDEWFGRNKDVSSFDTYTRIDVDARTGQRRPLNHTLSFTVDPERGYPLMLSTLRWSVKVLIARRFEDVEVPFCAARNRLSLADDVYVRIEEAVSGDQSYAYQLRAVYAGANPFVGHFIRVSDGSPKALILDIELLDGAGQVINKPGTPGMFSGSVSGGEGMVTFTGSGNCENCDGVQRMRFVVARDLVEEEVSLSLEGLPVPSF